MEQPKSYCERCGGAGCYVCESVLLKDVDGTGMLAMIPPRHMADMVADMVRKIRQERQDSNA